MNELKDWAPMFGANTRPVHEITLADLEEVNVPFSQYGITKGEKLQFVEKEVKFARQDPAEGANTANSYPSYRISCYRNGRKSWFDPGFVMRRDINGDYIYPEWAALGSAAEVAKALLKTGVIEGGENFKVTMRKRKNGVAVEEAIRKENGDLDLNEDGTPKMKAVGIERDYPTLPNPVV